jgi:hypothetical protein
VDDLYAISVASPVHTHTRVSLKVILLSHANNEKSAQPKIVSVPLSCRRVENNWNKALIFDSYTLYTSIYYDMTKWKTYCRCNDMILYYMNILSI